MFNLVAIVNNGIYAVLGRLLLHQVVSIGSTA